MENASKALLIAGAVLIVIVLISIGMMIVQQSQGVGDQVAEISSNQATTSFNSTFTKYQGSQKGSSIKTLLEEVSTNNANASKTSQHFVSVTIDDKVGDSTISTTQSPDDLTRIASKIVTSARYDVVMDGRDSEGFINSIVITRNSK